MNTKWQDKVNAKKLEREDRIFEHEEYMEKAVKEYNKIEGVKDFDVDGILEKLNKDFEGKLKFKNKWFSPKISYIKNGIREFVEMEKFGLSNGLYKYHLIKKDIEWKIKTLKG